MFSGRHTARNMFCISKQVPTAFRHLEGGTRSFCGNQDQLSMQPPISTRQSRVGRVLCLMLGLLIACAEPSFATPPASTGQFGPSKVMLSLFFVVMMMGSLGGKRAGLWSPPTRQKSSKRSSPTLDRIGTQLLSAYFLDSYFSLLTDVESLLDLLEVHGKLKDRKAFIKRWTDVWDQNLA